MDFDRLNQLFESACDLQGEARERFITTECGDDVEMASELRALLAADDRIPESFLTAIGPTVLSKWLPKGARSLPEQIGPYQIIREVGRGGMGVVYEAEQDEPRRRVAVKVIRLSIASDEVVRRFKRESRVLGNLQHPGIAHIYEAGTTHIGNETAPYYAMEFIDGRRIDKHLDKMEATPEERLELIAMVCDAVDHAHQHKVVHRDLKPANVLVIAPVGSESTAVGRTRRRAGQPKVLDFGVARVLDAEGTATHQKRTESDAIKQPESWPTTCAGIWPTSPLLRRRKPRGIGRPSSPAAIEPSWPVSRPPSSR